MVRTACETRADPRRVLARLLHEQPGLLEEPRRLEALLRDYCPQHRREILALRLALQERLVDDLLRLEGQLPLSALLARLTHQLQEAAGLAEPLARWSVVSWACALGCLAADADDALATETITASDTASDPHVAQPAVVVAVQPDPYAEVLRSAQEALVCARRTSTPSDALRWAEKALQLGEEALHGASAHSSLRALVIQARAEVARLCDELARDELQSGNASQASCYWQRVTEVAPTDREALVRLRQLADERARKRQAAEALWNGGKFRNAVAAWEQLLRRWPQDSDLQKICHERKAALTEVEQLCQEVTQLIQAGRAQRLKTVYARLETLAPTLKGLTESRAQLASQLQEIEPLLEAARAAMANAHYADALRHAQSILKRFVDHTEATILADQADQALGDYQNRLLAWRQALAASDLAEAQRMARQFTPSELKLPELTSLRSDYEGRLRLRRAQRLIPVATVFGLVAWLAAWWFAQQTARSWPEIARIVPAQLPSANASGLTVTALHGAFAAFLLGIVAALLRGRTGFISVAVLLGITWAHVLFLLSIEWLWQSVPTLNTTLLHVLAAGLYGIWLGVAVCCLTGRWDKVWALSSLAAILAASLWQFIDYLFVFEDRTEIARATLLASSLWMVGVLLLGWIKGLARFALVPCGLALAMLLPHQLAGDWSQVARPIATGTLLALALFTLTAIRLSWPQIGGIWLLACLASYAAQHFRPDFAWLAMLWCCAWFPRALERPSVAAAARATQT